MAYIKFQVDTVLLLTFPATLEGGVFKVSTFFTDVDRANSPSPNKKKYN